jgi:hypothetical protein
MLVNPCNPQQSPCSPDAVLLARFVNAVVAHALKDTLLYEHVVNDAPIEAEPLEI